MFKVFNMKTFLVISILFLFCSGISGARQQQVIRAVKANEKIIVDGKLNEQVWQGRGYGDFIQKEPEEGEPSSEKSLIRVAYDKKAIYISARLFDSEPEKIIGRLGRRDDFVDSDWFIFSVDPYYDHRSGYQFAVNPSGTVVDWTIYNDENHDSTWDGIWESCTRIDKQGWTVEMKIPFEQLRFKKKDKYVWGVNFMRYIKRKNEEAGMVYVPQKESGFVSHFARLEGIKDIDPGRYIEMVPYANGKASFGTPEEGNPFETGKEYFANGGLDMKVGLKSNLTLALTINPDFGQVEVDPAQINLSAAESYYSERRPFFVEGADTFRFGYGGSNRNVGANWGNPSFFYSRRIGRSPQCSVNTGGYVRYPEWSTILGAAKVTGKVGNGWNVGFLSALTQTGYADIDLDGKRFREKVEPFTYYGVLRAQKEFNSGRQGLGFIGTGMVRSLDTDLLADSLNSNAFSFGMDGWTFLDKDNVWVVSGWFGATRVAGSRERILNLQHSYPHYFQRPDADHVSLDPNATSMSGWAGRLAINKQKGNFLVNAAIGAISPGFDSRDMGFQWNSDIINGHIMVSYRSFKPGKIIRDWKVSLFTQRNYDFGGRKIGEQRLIFISSLKFMNYWTLHSEVSYNPPRWSNDFTRGGPLTRLPTQTWGSIGIYSDSRRALSIDLFYSFSRSADGSNRNAISGGLHWKPSTNFSVSIYPKFDDDSSAAQWVTDIEAPYMTSTYGSRYIFGAINQKTVSCSIRMNWIFSPTLSLQAYLQPFIAVGDYYDYKELARPRSYEFNRYGQNNSTITYNSEMDEYRVNPDGIGNANEFVFGNPDFNYKSLRGTIVLRWEYLPGSTVYAVWTQNRADYGHPGEFRLGRDFRDLLRAPGEDVFMIKFTYRFKL